MSSNVLGQPLQACCYAPLTGFYRDGFCRTGPDDKGLHTVCIVATAEFLAFSREEGNDLSTPLPKYDFPGLKPGDQWCLCVTRWVDAFKAGKAPRVVLEATHIHALEFIALEDLQAHASEMNAKTVITASPSQVTGGWRLEHSYARLPGGFFTSVSPTPVSSPRLVLLNRPLAEELGLNPADLARPENTAWFAGNVLPPGAIPIAQAYSGHQYGNFVRLGDGRAILLGEQITPRGERFDIQLKGSGPTPYSRRGDGRAALGPMLREYIISEAMHALRIPSTRSLAVVATGEPVFRETTLHGAILTRVAASHLRVGTVEWAASTGEIENLRGLLDYTLQRHYPSLRNVEQPYVALLKAVMERQAALIARWQHVGFVHGVMNTDNMALSGETIDYGPCAFMDAYHPGTVFSSIDYHGRYAYANQPKIAHWNLSRFASAMLPLLHTDEDEAVAVANRILQTFPEIFRTHWLAGQRAKLGLFNEEPGDAELAESLLAIMQEQEADFTNTFRDLSGPTMTNVELAAHHEFRAWHTRWQERLGRQPQNGDEARALMRQHNPAFIPRNHKVEEALAAATHGELSKLEKLLDVITQPFAYDRQLPGFSTPPPPNAPAYQTFCGT